MEKLDIFDMASRAYSAFKGGSYGKIKYFRLYKKVAEYVDSRHSGAKCSDLLKTNDGWSCIIREGNKSIILYITKTHSGEISFWEKEV